MSQLFSSGSCGPVNPLQNLGKYTGPTNSSQHERFVREGSSGSFRSSPSPSVGNNEFQAFSRGQTTQPNSFEFQNMGPVQTPAAQQQQQQAFNQQQQRSQSSTPDWSSEFSKLSVNPVKQELRIRQSPGPSNIAYQQQFPQYARSDLVNYQQPPTFSQQSEHDQIHKLNEQQKSFENVFADVERSLQTDDELNQQLNHNSSDNELSGVAQNIIDSVNETSQSISKSTASKMKSSNFMALMDQLSKKNVVLEGNKFVDGVSKTEVKPEQLSRQEETSLYEQPSLPQSILTNSTSTTTSTSDAHQIPIQDPFSFFDQMNIDPSKLTPFEIAQSLNPHLKPADWEEKYNEDADWTQ